VSLFKVFEIAGSGLSAQSVRLNVTASNLANADSVSSSLDETYRARYPLFAAVFDDTMDDSPSVGVQVKEIVQSSIPLPMEYLPEHPAANADGYIYRTNVNAIEQMADMISASRSYQGNVEVMNASKQMLMRTLSLGG